jgi:hypothetical protein
MFEQINAVAEYTPDGDLCRLASVGLDGPHTISLLVQQDDAESELIVSPSEARALAAALNAAADEVEP